MRQAIYPSYAGLQPKGLSKQLRGSYTRANSFASGISYLGYAVEVFFITDIWLYLYNNLLNFFNLRFPAKLQEFFYITGAAPEPYEIPLYFSLSALAIFAIYIFHRILREKTLETSRTRSFFLFFLLLFALLILLAIFLLSLGEFPLQGVVDPYQPHEDKNLYLISFITYVAVMAVLIAEIVFVKKLLQGLKKWTTLLLVGLVLLIISVLIFEPRFPISGLDYAYFYGPIWEVAKGKTILTEVPSQYGILPIVVFAFLYRLGLFNFGLLPLIFWSFFVSEYGLIFYLLLRISRSVMFSAIGLFSIITMSYFSIAHVPIFTPQAGPLRWLPLFFILFLFYKLKKIYAKLLIFVIGLTTFWITDAGLYAILAYLVTLILLVFHKDLSSKKALVSIGWLLASLLGIFLILNGVNLVLGYQPINILLAFSKIQKYAKAGYNMIKLFPQSYFWFVPLFYFASIIYFFRHTKSTFLQQFLVFAAHLSFFSGIYFVGRSHPHSLFWIAPMALFSFFVLMALILQNLRFHWQRFILGVTFFLLFIVYPAFQRKEIIMESTIQRYKRLAEGKIFHNELDDYLAKKYAAEKTLINSYLKDKKVAILHPDDTYLLYLTKKESLILANPQMSILTPDDLAFALKDVYSSCPRSIAVDCRLVGKCQENWVFTGVTVFIQPFLLAAIEKNCQISYKPIVCTGQLCIVKAKAY